MTRPTMALILIISNTDEKSIKNCFKSSLAQNLNGKHETHMSLQVLIAWHSISITNLILSSKMKILQNNYSLES